MTVEKMLDRFSNDYYRFLARQHSLTTDFKLKVVCCNSQNWSAMIPRQLQNAAIQFQHIFALTFGKPNGKRPSESDKKWGLMAVGFPRGLAASLTKYDALFFTNLDDPARTRNGDPLIWNLPLSHHILHLVEVMADVTAIPEAAAWHDYESEAALEPFRKFTAEIGLDEMVNRYVPWNDQTSPALPCVANGN
jgi:hypothetical protein